MAIKTYLKVNGIDGEATDDGHEKWINVSGFHHGIRQESYGNSSGRAANQTGVADAQEFIVTKELDAATPNLNQYCAAHKPIDEVTLEMVDMANGDAKVLYAITLNKAAISSVQISAGGEFPSETLAFRYSKIKWSYTPKNDDTSDGGKVEAQWDFKKNA